MIDYETKPTLTIICAKCKNRAQLFGVCEKTPYKGLILCKVCLDTVNAPSFGPTELKEVYVQWQENINNCHSTSKSWTVTRA